MSGYAPFRYDVTDWVSYGAKNVIVVRVDATQNDGWFYEGAGIYRHVWLLKTHPVHVAHGGTLVVSEVRPGSSTLAVTTEVENHSDRSQAGRVVSTVLDPAGKVVASATAVPVAIAPWSGNEFKQQLSVGKPALWSLENPNLYRLLTKVEVAGAVVDQYETTFGIRSIRFDADQGFFLNGASVRLLGTCNHQDHAGVGSALPDRIQAFRIEKLKETFDLTFQAMDEMDGFRAKALEAMAQGVPAVVPAVKTACVRLQWIPPMVLCVEWRPMIPVHLSQFQLARQCSAV